MLTCLASQCLDVFSGNDGHRKEGGQKVGPPQTEERVEKQASQKDRRKIRTEFGLPGFCVHHE